jgi:putative FmdB family regulatory protein
MRAHKGLFLFTQSEFSINTSRGEIGTEVIPTMPGPVCTPNTGEMRSISSQAIFKRKYSLVGRAPAGSHFGYNLIMPIYPFVCLACNQRFVICLSYSEYDQAVITCPYCGSQQVERRLARVRFTRSDDSRLESLADPTGMEGLEDDPKALGKLMRQMGRESGQKLGAEFDEVVERLEAGQALEDIERDLPDLGGDDLSDIE